MSVGKEEDSLIYKTFNKIGLEGSSTEEFQEYLRNIFEYKDPKALKQTKRKHDFNVEYEPTNSTLNTFPEKLSISSLGKTKLIELLQPLGDSPVIENNIGNEEIATEGTQKDAKAKKIYFNKTLSHEEIKKLLIELGN